jgi:hypothetical protein
MESDAESEPMRFDGERRETILTLVEPEGRT